jgi:putative DNA primase/helicase
MSSDADVDKIRGAIDIAQYIARYIELKKNGSELKGLCPFHDDRNPSLSVSPTKQLWACFACGAHEQHGADIFGFVRSYFDCTFPEAIAKLQNGNAVDPKPIQQEPRKKAPPRQQLVPPVGSLPEFNRGDLGAPITHWIIRRPDGAPWFYEARYMLDGKKETRFFTYGRYSDSELARWECKHPANPRPFFGLDQLAARPDAQVMIHEAPKKAVAAAPLLTRQVHLGMVGGANAAKYMDLEPLRGRKVVLLPDNDDAGRRAMQLLGERLEPLVAQLRRTDTATQPDETSTPQGWDIADAEGWTPEIAKAWAAARTFPFRPDAPQEPPERAVSLPPAPAPNPADEPPIAQPAPKRGNGQAGPATVAIPAMTPEQRVAMQEARARAEVLSRLVYTRISDVAPEAVKWLWPGRIPLGELTMIVGDPGLGKSQICASLASVVTNGGLWPVDRNQAEQGSVLILSAEDNVRHTIRPRLDAAGADVTRCHTLQAVKRTDDRGGEFISSFNLAEDLAKLAVLMDELRDVRLVVIDPVSAYLGETDSHKNAEVRGMLAPLTTLAGSQNAAIILVSHLTKSQSTNALMRVQGSIAFAALCRAVWGVAADKDNRQRRLFMPLKNNLGQDKTGLAYEIEGFALPTDPPIPTSRVMWEGQLVETTTEEVFGAPLTHEERAEMGDAKEFLREALSEGRVKASEVQRAAKSAGHSLTTLQRAKKSLGIVSEREGFGKDAIWYWKVKEPESEKRAPPDWMP